MAKSKLKLIEIITVILSAIAILVAGYSVWVTKQTSIETAKIAEKVARETTELQLKKQMAQSIFDKYYTLLPKIDNLRKKTESLRNRINVMNSESITGLNIEYFDDARMSELDSIIGNIAAQLPSLSDSAEMRTVNLCKSRLDTIKFIVDDRYKVISNYSEPVNRERAVKLFPIDVKNMLGYCSEVDSCCDAIAKNLRSKKDYIELSLMSKQ